MGGQAEEQEQKLYVDFQKAQYSLLHVLSENFGTHENRLSQNTILFSLWKNSRPSTWSIGTLSSSSFPTSQDRHHVVALRVPMMCLYNIAAKYIDTGVTDAITKHVAYVASKPFTTVFLRARRNPLPKMSRLPWMMCPPLCASKNTIVNVSEKENGSNEQRQEQTKA